MATKKEIYGLLGPKKLNPNLIVLGLVFLAAIAIVVFNGRHNKISIYKFWTIETNIPSQSIDSPSKVDRETTRGD